MLPDCDATSRRLIDATIDLLHDKGLKGTSLPEIARKAGICRRALNHRFAGRPAIIGAAVADMLSRTTRDLRRFAEEVAGRDGAVDEIVDRIWRVMSDRVFQTTLEFLPEARHDAALKARLLPAVQEFHAGLDAIWTAIALRHGADPDEVRNAMNATMCVARGLIAHSVLQPGPADDGVILDFWKRQMRRQLPARAMAG